VTFETRGLALASGVKQGSILSMGTRFVQSVLRASTTLPQALLFNRF
jgi:hypothetical protein